MNVPDGCCTLYLLNGIFTFFFSEHFKTATENVLLQKYGTVHPPPTCFPSTLPPESNKTSSVGFNPPPDGSQHRHSKKQCQRKWLCWHPSAISQIKKVNCPINHCCHLCNNETFASALYYDTVTQFVQV